MNKLNIKINCLGDVISWEALSKNIVQSQPQKITPEDFKADEIRGILSDYLAKTLGNLAADQHKGKKEDKNKKSAMRIQIFSKKRKNQDDVVYSKSDLDAGLLEKLNNFLFAKAFGLSLGMSMDDANDPDKVKEKVTNIYNKDPNALVNKIFNHLEKPEKIKQHLQKGNVNNVSVEDQLEVICKPGDRFFDRLNEIVAMRLNFLSPKIEINTDEKFMQYSWEEILADLMKKGKLKVTYAEHTPVAFKLYDINGDSHILDLTNFMDKIIDLYPEYKKLIHPFRDEHKFTAEAGLYNPFPQDGEELEADDLIFARYINYQTSNYDYYLVYPEENDSETEQLYAIVNFRDGKLTAYLLKDDNTYDANTLEVDFAIDKLTPEQKQWLAELPGLNIPKTPNKKV